MRKLDTTYEVWTTDPDEILTIEARLATFRAGGSSDLLAKARGYIAGLPAADRPYASIVKVTREAVS